MEKREIPILIIFLVLVAISTFMVLSFNRRREEGRENAIILEEKMWNDIRNPDYLVLTHSTFNIPDQDYEPYLISRGDYFYQSLIESLEPYTIGGSFDKGLRVLYLEFELMDDQNNYLATIRIIQDDYDSDIVLVALADRRSYSYTLENNRSDLYEEIMRDIQEHLEEQNVYYGRRYPD